MLATRRWPVRLVTRSWTTSSIVRATMRASSSPTRRSPAIIASVARRSSASRGELPWMVVSEPSWPVFIASSMSSASAPRTSPTMMRVGRMRSALRTRSRMRDLADALDVLAAHLQRHAVRQLAVELQLGDFLDGHHALVERGDRGAERVQQGGLARAGLAADQNVHAGLDGRIEELGRRGRQRAQLDQLVAASGRAAANLRMVSDVQRVDAGGITAFRREPSGSRTSTIGEASSSRRPSGADDAFDQLAQLVVVVEVHVRRPALCARRGWRRCAAGR